MKIIYLSATLLFHSEFNANVPMRFMATESTYFDTHAECVAKARKEIAEYERREKATFIKVFDGYFCEVDELKVQELRGQKRPKSLDKKAG